MIEVTTAGPREHSDPVGSAVYGLEDALTEVSHVDNSGCIGVCSQTLRNCHSGLSEERPRRSPINAPVHPAWRGRRHTEHTGIHSVGA